MSSTLNEDSECCKVILDVIKEIRNSKKQTESKNVLTVTVEKHGLDAVDVKKNIYFLIKSGAIINKPTNKGRESFFGFDMESLINNQASEDDGSVIQEDDRSLSTSPQTDYSSMLGKKFGNSENRQTEFMAFLKIFDKLTDDIRRLNLDILKEQQDKNSLKKILCTASRKPRL